MDSRPIRMMAVSIAGVADGSAATDTSEDGGAAGAPAPSPARDQGGRSPARGISGALARGVSRRQGTRAVTVVINRS